MSFFDFLHHKTESAAVLIGAFYLTWSIIEFLGLGTIPHAGISLFFPAYIFSSLAYEYLLD